jgi:hypothetical protein
MKETIFELKEEHIKLAQKMYVTWDDCEFGAPAIDPKRPYGNSDVLGDIAEILGLQLFEDAEGEKHLSKEQDELCNKLHEEMETALQIILRCKTFELGTYTHQEYHYTEWYRVTP